MLSDLSEASGGDYSCEVSTGAPRFSTHTLTKELVVIVPRCRFGKKRIVSKGGGMSECHTAIIFFSFFSNFADIKAKILEQEEEMAMSGM